MKTKVKLASGILSLTLSLSVIGGLCNVPLHIESSAATATNFTVEDYTKDDKLLLPDGTLSGKTIGIFADDVKAAPVETDCSEITQVIPVEYLSTTEKDAVYQYNGKEYGFYLAKDGDYFDLLLIDFVYEFEDTGYHNNEYKIRVEPILQQSFRRYEENGGYVWKKWDTESRYVYYVANPSFFVTLNNENALNYGDEGYDKQKDSGLIIQQSRVNYGKISYKTGTDALKELARFAGLKVLDFFVDSLDKITFNIAGYIKDGIELGFDMYQQGQEVTVLADNENDIFTEQSRQDQYENPDIEGYSRVAGFAPKEEMILSGDENSYAEYITLLNDTNSRSRLTQICNFDIVRRKGNWSSMQYVTNAAQEGENVDGHSFAFLKTRVLFDDYGVTQLANDRHSQQTQAYFLSDGNQVFEFEAAETAVYGISAPVSLADVEVFEGEKSVATTKPDNRSVEMRLEAGKNYRIILSQKERGYYNITFLKKSTPIEAFGSYTVNALTEGESQSFRYQPDENTTLTVAVDSSKYILRVYCDENNYLEKLYGDPDEKEFDAEKGCTYYIELINKTGEELTSGSFTISKVGELVCNHTSEYFSISDRRTFLFNAPVDGKYEITGLADGLTHSTDAPFVNGGYYLSAGAHYIVIEGSLIAPARTQCRIGFAADEIFVNGGEGVQIAGNMTSVFLKFVPKITAEYIISLPTNIGIKYLIYDNMVQRTELSDESFLLQKDVTYYFSVVKQNSVLPLLFGAVISPVTAGNIETGSNGSGELTLSGLSFGEYFIVVNIPTLNIYTVSGISQYSFYDGALTEMFPSSVLPAGRYYLKVTISAGQSCTIRIEASGFFMEVGDVIGVVNSRIFKYELLKGEEYEIYIGGSKNHSFTTSISLRDSQGALQEIEKSGDYYSFEATDTTMFIELTMSNVNGQAGIFVLEKKGENSQTNVQKLSLGKLYTWNTSNGGKYFKLTSGSYKLLCNKKVGENISLYQLSGTSLIENENWSDTTDKRAYEITITTTTVFLIQTDQVEVDFLPLPGNEDTIYTVKVEEGALSGEKLIRGNNYTFGLYYEFNNKEGRIDVPLSEFKVYANDKTTGNEIFLSDDYYNFYNYDCDKIIVSVYFWSLSAENEFEVSSPQTVAEYFVNEGYFSLRTETACDTYSEFVPDRITISVFDAAELKTALETQSYFTSSAVIDLDSYCWENALWAKISCRYKDQKNRYFTIETVKEYKSVSAVINQTIDLSQIEYIYIDATQISGTSATLNKKIIIPSNIKMISFEGKSNLTLEKLNISIDGSRSTSLLLNMKNFNFTFNVSNYGLSEIGEKDVYLNVVGSCSIVPAASQNSTAAGHHAIAVTANTLNIRGSGSLYVQGSDDFSVADKKSGNGNLGASGIGAGELIVSVKELTAIGGKGGKGLDASETISGTLNGKNGGNGGTGGYALFVYKLQVLSGCESLNLYGGNGGDGGVGAAGSNGSEGIAGGRGGNGGDGGDGGVQIFNTGNVEISSSTKYTKQNGVCGNGGNGGRGGDGGPSANGGNGGTGGKGYKGGRGGDGGNGGHGLNDTSTKGGCTDGGNGGNGGKGGYSECGGGYARPGNGGNGGNGGDPGNFGDGKKGGDGGYGYYGGNGGNGSDAKIIFGKGGKAGKGGDAYGGEVGQPGQRGGGTRKGDSNVSGANLGDADGTYSNYPES